MLSKYIVIFTQLESIDIGPALVNNVEFSNYKAIFSEQKVNNCIIFYCELELTYKSIGHSAGFLKCPPATTYSMTSAFDIPG